MEKKHGFWSKFWQKVKTKKKATKEEKKRARLAEIEKYVEKLNKEADRNIQAFGV